jgi:hypothetical protein
MLGGPQSRSRRHGKVRILVPTGARNSDPLVVQPVASRYTDCAIAIVILVRCRRVCPGWAWSELGGWQGILLGKRPRRRLRRQERDIHMDLRDVSFEEGKSNAVLVHNSALSHEDMWWSEGIHLYIVKVGIIWRCLISFAFRPIYPPEKRFRYPLDRGMCRPQSKYGRLNLPVLPPKLAIQSVSRVLVW